MLRTLMNNLHNLLFSVTFDWFDLKNFTKINIFFKRLMKKIGGFLLLIKKVVLICKLAVNEFSKEFLI